MYNQVSPMQSVPKYAFIFAGINILFSIIMYVTGLMTNQIASSLSGIVILVVSIFCIHMAIRSHRDELQNGFITLGKGFTIGILVALLGSVIVAIFNYILYAFIDPDLLTEIMDQAMNQPGMENVPEESFEMMEMFMNPAMMSLSTIFSGLCCGGVVALVVALIDRNEPNDNQI